MPIKILNIKKKLDILDDYLIFLYRFISIFSFSIVSNSVLGEFTSVILNL